MLKEFSKCLPLLRQSAENEKQHFFSCIEFQQIGSYSIFYYTTKKLTEQSNFLISDKSQNTNHRLQMLRGSKNQYKKSKLNSLSITDNSKVKKSTTNDIKRIKLIKKKLKLRQLTKAKKKVRFVQIKCPLIFSNYNL